MSPDHAVSQNETQDLSTPTSRGGLDEGIALALRADESGDWKAVADWLARNIELAGSLARFLAGQRDIESAVAPVRHIVGWEPGTVIGGFALLDEIGRGGMGVVYRAHDPVLKRDVAMKLVRTGAKLSADELARFRFEAEVSANFDHPNIVRVFAFGESDGMPYLVMPFMEGGSLAQRLKSLGPDRCLPPKEAAGLVRDIALGVHHAHQRGLIHRDLKPGNILIDSAGRPHVADFGLARALDVTASVSGAVAGTPAYMAPEQARGAKVLTVAADVHALGGILFELLTGFPPFGVSGDYFAILKRVQEETAPSIRGIRKEVPGDLDAICQKCLEKDPKDRYRSSQELADDLTRFINGEPVQAHPPGFGDWLRQLLRTRPDPDVNYSWQVTAWFGVNILSTNMAMFAMFEWDWPALGIWAAVAVSASANTFVLWWYMLRRFRQLPTTERHSLIIAAGNIAATTSMTVAYVPFSTAPAPEALAMYPALAAVSGLGMFTLGSTNWSRFLLIGLAMIGLAPIMARWPSVSPIIYGVAIAIVMWYWAYIKRHTFGVSAIDKH